jgi:hypothetical protein
MPVSRKRKNAGKGKGAKARQKRRSEQRAAVRGMMRAEPFGLPSDSLMQLLALARLAR